MKTTFSAWVVQIHNCQYVKVVATTPAGKCYISTACYEEGFDLEKVKASFADKWMKKRYWDEDYTGGAEPANAIQKLA